MNSGPELDQIDLNQRTSPDAPKVRTQSAHDTLVMRRVEGGRMLKAGARPSDVATALGVSRSTVYAWKAVLDAGGGLTGLRRLSRGGRPPRLSDADVAWLKRAVALETPEKHQIHPSKWGLPKKRWTAALVCMLVKLKFGVDLSEVQIRRLVDPFRD
jgi:transposase